MVTAFTNDVLTVQNALVTLCAAFTDPNGGSVTASRTIPTGGISDDDLPYVWVRRGRQTGRNEMASDTYQDTRPYQALVYVTRLQNGEFDDETSFDNAVNWIKPFHKYLADNRDFHTATWIEVASVRDTGDISLITKSAVRYAGVVFTIPIKTLTRF